MQIKEARIWRTGKQQDFFDDLKLVKLVEWSQQDLSEIITVTTYNNYKDSMAA